MPPGHTAYPNSPHNPRSHFGWLRRAPAFCGGGILEGFRSFISRSERPRRSVLANGAALVGVALALLGLTSIPAVAGEGNSNYLGILDSTAPTGYTPSPSS